MQSTDSLTQDQSSQPRHAHRRSLPASLTSTPRHSSPLNPACVAGTNSGRDGKHGQGHRHSESFCGSPASSCSSPLSFPSPGYEPGVIPGAHQSAPVLGSPFKPSPDKTSRARGLSLSISPTRQPDPSTLSALSSKSSPVRSPPTRTPSLLSPSATLRPEALTDDNVRASRGRARSGSAPKSLTVNISGPGGIPPPLAPTHSRASFWRRDEEKLLSPSNSNHSRPWHTMFDMSASAKDRPRRHSVATGTPTKEGKEGKEGKEADMPSVPAEQMENWDITRKRVAQAASSVLGTTALIAHEILLTSVDLFELAPVPGLQAAARTLLKIWDCLQQVDSNRLQCLRLTEHCADILLSVRQEVYEAGDEVEDELRLPFDKLTESFNDVHALLVKQAGRPFLKRYLKRDEISKQLHQCDIGLQEALGMFSISIQIRILKQVQLAEARRQHDTQELLRGVANLSHLSQYGYPIQLDPPSYSTSTTPRTSTALDSGMSKSSEISGQASEPFPSANASSASPRPPFPYAASNLLMLSKSRSVSAYASASVSSQSLHGLPTSSSHTSLSQSASTIQSKDQSLEAYSWKYNSNVCSVNTSTGETPPSINSPQRPTLMSPVDNVSPKDLSTMIPSVSITPSSRPSTATSSSTASVQYSATTGHVINHDTHALLTQAGQMSKSPLPQPPIQLIPTKSSIEAAGAVLEAIQRQGKILPGSAEVETSSFGAFSAAATSTATVTPDANSVAAASTTSTSASATTSLTTAHPVPPALLPSASSLPSTEILPTILSLTRHQAALDAESDYADLRGVMRAALSKGSDVEIIKVLGVGLRKGGLGRGSVGQLEGLSKGNSGFGEDGGIESIESGGLDAGEVAEAIKTLQRAHEAILEMERREDSHAQQRLQQEQGDVPNSTQVHVSQITSQQSLKIEAQEVQLQQQRDRSELNRRFSVLSDIKRKMNFQNSRSYTSTTALTLPTSLNEDIIHEESESGDGDRKRKGGRLRSKRGKVAGAGAKLMRSKAVSSSSTSSTATTNESAWSRSGSGSGSGVSQASGNGEIDERYMRKKDTLDKEFIESGIDALRRMSRSTAVHKRTKTKSREELEDPARLLPSWTITRYEIDREEKIGVGFFSDVYKGTWRPPSVPSAPSYPYSAITAQVTTQINSSSLPYSSRIVAIKVLAETTPRSLFLRETAIWKKLSHPNVLELYGASSASGDPPWFFVSPYMQNGSLAEYLRRNSTLIPHSSSLDEGYSKLPWGLILPGNSAYGIYEATGIGRGEKSLPKYAKWNGGGLGSLVGAHTQGFVGHTSASTISEAAIGLGLNLQRDYASPSDSSRSLSSSSLPLHLSSSHIRRQSGSALAGASEPVQIGRSGNVEAPHLNIENVPKEWDLLRFVHEIAQGMEYLHSQGVLHGDLKASNILVDDDIHCAISDFGQSEMRSEAYRLSGTAPPHGTVRWQAPEILAGFNQLTVEMDVYAFAVCCTEVLSLGRMPWPLYDDMQVQSHIMANQRPDVPPTYFTTPDLITLIQACWAANPLSRPPFSKIAAELESFRTTLPVSSRVTRPVTIDPGATSLQFKEQHELAYHLQHPRFLPSPDMHPPLSEDIKTPPRDSSRRMFIHETPPSSYSYSCSDASSEDDSFKTANEVSMSAHGVAVRAYPETPVTASSSVASTITAKANVSTTFVSPEFPFIPAGTLPFSPATALSSPTPPTFSPMSTTTSPHTAGSLSHDYNLADNVFRPYSNNSNNNDVRYGHVESLSATSAQSQIPKDVALSQPSSSPTSSIFTSSLSESEEGYTYNGNKRVPGEEFASGNRKMDEYGGYDSPPPVNDLIAEARNERRYRLLLVHDFHPSLTLPLWSPAPVTLGSVGYLSKPKGEFVTLFNAFYPQNSDVSPVRCLPSVHGYGKFSTGSQRQDKRNAAQRSLDAVAGLLTLKGRGGNISKSVSRRYSYPLRAGHKTAHLCTERTMYHYMESLDAPKKWFKANVDTVLEVFGSQHQIQKEDLFFVIGTLDTPEYALFVSHNHPDGQVHFNAFTSSKSRQPWGRFSTDTKMPFELGGPSYHEPVSGSPVSANKISPQGTYPWSTVLMARLRFKPDVLEPTSL